MKTEITNDIFGFVLGNSTQDYYKRGRKLTHVCREDIESICRCGYLTLKPKTKYESIHGGLTVKKSQVIITDRNGRIFKRLNPNGTDIYRTSGCNACVNNWK